MKRVAKKKHKWVADCPSAFRHQKSSHWIERDIVGDPLDNDYASVQIEHL